VRVDKFLSRVGLVRRTELKQDRVEIRINGKEVKPSKDVKVGDIIEFISPTLLFRVEVLRLPEKKGIPAKMRSFYYRVIYRSTKHKEIKSEFIKWLLED